MEIIFNMNLKVNFILFFLILNYVSLNAQHVLQSLEDASLMYDYRPLNDSLINLRETGFVPSVIREKKIKMLALTDSIKHFVSYECVPTSKGAQCDTFWWNEKGQLVKTYSSSFSPNGIHCYYYDKMNRLKAFVEIWGSVDSTVYAYDEFGRIRVVFEYNFRYEMKTDSTVYFYDSVGRLQKMSGSLFGEIHTFNYSDPDFPDFPTCVRYYENGNFKRGDSAQYGLSRANGEEVISACY